LVVGQKHIVQALRHIGRHFFVAAAAVAGCWEEKEDPSAAVVGPQPVVLVIISMAD
jgi:hypothetical protein